MTFAIAVVIALCLAGCDSDDGPAKAAGTGAAAATSTAAGETTKAPEAFPPADVTADDFDPALFDPQRSFVVDNEWLPLEPGTRWEHRGWTEEEGKRISHTIVFVITDLVKEIDGVRALVGWERDFSDGELVEAEVITLAQDRGGNVWHFGQYSEVYEEGEFGGGSAWFVGALDGAKAGILMKANPELGQPRLFGGIRARPLLLGRLGQGVQGRGEHLRSGRLLRRRARDRRVRAEEAGGTPAQVLRPRCRQHPHRLAG